MSKLAFVCGAAAAGLLVAAIAQPAGAADLWGPNYGSIKDAPPPVYAFTWTGFYVGGHAGLMTGNTEGTPDFKCGGDPDCRLAERIFSTDYDMNGAFYGGQIGYNYQFGAAVVGIEGSFSGSSAEGDGPAGPLLITSKRELDWLATVTGRIGYAMGRSLVYAKGGVAWGELQTDVRFGGLTVLSGDETHVGWTAGLGVEHALTDRVTVRIEYAHIDLGSEDHTLKFGGDPVLKSEVEAEFDTLSLGVNYKF